MGMPDPIAPDDATLHADHALVTGPEQLRFYAGVPLITKAGIALGTLCIMGREPRRLSAEEQLQLLRNLPEGGLALLSDTLEHWHTNARLLQLMIGWWMQTPPKEVSLTLPGTFSSELNDVLMNARNQRWCHFLQQLPAGRYVVAVGALHLYGECNLLDLLKNR